MFKRILLSLIIALAFKFIVLPRFVTFRQNIPVPYNCQPIGNSFCDPNAENMQALVIFHGFPFAEYAYINDPRDPNKPESATSREWGSYNELRLAFIGVDRSYLDRRVQASGSSFTIPTYELDYIQHSPGWWPNNFIYTLVAYGAITFISRRKNAHTRH